MLPFLRCVGEAVVARGMRGLMALVPFGEQIYEVSADAIERYRKQGKEREIAADIEATLRADIEDVRRQSAQIAAEVAAGRPAEEVERLTAYLTQVPSVAKQSLKRPADPTGTTVATSFDALDPVQLASLLPARSPRFKAGDLVPHASEWELVGLLGSGGFGDVWLARHTFLDEQRAFKFCLDPVARDRLLRHEGEVIKRVMQASRGVRADEHGIVPLRGAYLAGEVPWLAYEYIDGGDLAALGREIQGLPAPERSPRALEVLRSLTGVVGAFHRLPTPVIHRDLKPANVLVNKTPTGGYVLRVTDFGIGRVSADAGIRQAAISTPNMSLGETYRGAHTPIYASPQQKRGATADPRDDVFALGIIGYQLLLGDFAVERPAGKWRKRLAGCEVADSVLNVLESCWDDDPDERPRDGAELSERLAPSATLSVVAPPSLFAAATSPSPDVWPPLTSSDLPMAVARWLIYLDADEVPFPAQWWHFSWSTAGGEVSFCLTNAAGVKLRQSPRLPGGLALWKLAKGRMPCSNARGMDVRRDEFLRAFWKPELDRLNRTVAAAETLGRHVGPRFEVRIDLPRRMRWYETELPWPTDPTRAAETDPYAVVRPRGVDAIELVVEMRRASLLYKRARSFESEERAIARAGAAALWVVDLEAGTVIEHRDPQGDRYERTMSVGRDKVLSLPNAPEVRIAAADLIGA